MKDFTTQENSELNYKDFNFRKRIEDGKWVGSQEASTLNWKPGFVPDTLIVMGKKGFEIFKLRIERTEGDEIYCWEYGNNSCTCIIKIFND